MHHQNIIQYMNFFSFIFFIFSFCCISLFFSWILGGRSTSQDKNIPFESGAPSTGNSHLRFSIKFYLIAMFFVIFDIESLYIYSWSTCIRETKWIGLIEMSFFIFMILLSLIYLFRIKTLKLFENNRFKNNNSS
ncbi:NADH-quinone oxidoreductase subunit A [Buchnera aphidicola]|uniref:NADH-quinone oxidoreductase subunit A n=1 Tax=Buchnera aphidicola TaxID=9 RepID=UPI002238C672|nr:NADH-quinone oxidoreductase subunit A [Buchnera aphidicola]MCW5197648.1 NADH-quinone oxidoreductase subunit A [Buchnera aphidicola (Chaitophorus viminalis)]